MAKKVVEMSSVGKALSGGIRGANSMVGCAGDHMTINADVEVPAGTQMCYIKGSEKVPVRLAQDLMEGQMTVIVEMEDGSRRGVDTEYLMDVWECNDD